MDLSKIPKTFSPRIGPEWGSGGVFGLRYYKDTLYFTLAFEAESHFIYDEDHQIYRFEYVGTKPVSGGDTYNAVETVDDKIYFGGWVHAPAIYAGREEGGSRILFNNKFSHVHEYDLRERSIRLLWKEGIGDVEKWAGEVSEIIYDPASDQLFIARADGHENLGVYILDPKRGSMNRLSDKPALKGSYYLDYVCFDISTIDAIEGFQCIDLYTRKWSYYQIKDLSKISIDKGGARNYSMGVATQGYGRFFAFTRSGVFIGNPVESELEEISFVRLFDLGTSGLSPRRTTVLSVGGGFLISYNSYVEAAFHLGSQELILLSKRLNYITSPTVLLYITPPMARIVGVFGARITSMERIGDKILLGYSTTANLGGRDASLIDSGVRGITIINEDIILGENPPYSARISLEDVSGRTFGGIPLYGYKEKILTIYSDKNSEMIIYEYDLGLPPQLYSEDKIEIRKGLNKIDLSGYRHIVSFNLRDKMSGVMTIDLLA